MSLITLGFLVALSLLTLFGSKPPLVAGADKKEEEAPVSAEQGSEQTVKTEGTEAEEAAKAAQGVVEKLEPFKDRIGYFGIIWGILAACIKLFSVSVMWQSFIPPVANVILVVIALPFGLGKILDHFPNPNPVVVEETDKMIEFIRRNNKVFAIVGFVAAGLTFVTAFP